MNRQTSDRRLAPGILIVCTALAFMLLALAMEPVADPRLRRTT